MKGEKERKTNSCWAEMSDNSCVRGGSKRKKEDILIRGFNKSSLSSLFLFLFFPLTLFFFSLPCPILIRASFPSTSLPFPSHLLFFLSCPFLPPSNFFFSFYAFSPFPFSNPMRSCKYSITFTTTISHTDQDNHHLYNSRVCCSDNGRK